MPGNIRIDTFVEVVAFESSTCGHFEVEDNNPLMQKRYFYLEIAVILRQ